MAGVESRDFESPHEKEHVTAGGVHRIAPGHDASVVGDEPAGSVEFQGAANYAKG